MLESPPSAPLPAALLSRLEGGARRLLEVAAELAAGRGVGLFLVGGATRDLLLGFEVRDLDLAVEGEVEPLASALAERVGGKLRLHPSFGTATVLLPSGGSVDLATCRSENYASPGALPAVRRSRIAEDLARRDFTINAVALRLSPGGASPWVDPFDGRADIERRLLRVLHPGSFRDDPTRILRGVRLAVRLGFAFDDEAIELARSALAAGAFTTLSGDRLRSELLPTLAHGGGALRLLDSLGGLAALDPEVTGGSDAAARVDAALRSARDGAAACQGAGLPPAESGWTALLALAWDLERGARGRLAARLGLTGSPEAAISGVGERLEAALAVVGREHAAPSAVVGALDRLSSEDLALLGGLLRMRPASASASTGRAWVDRYLRELRAFELAVGGEDLLAVGVPEGPELGRLLDELRRARLDGEVVAGDEIAYVRRRLAAKEGY